MNFNRVRAPRVIFDSIVASVALQIETQSNPKGLFLGQVYRNLSTSRSKLVSRNSFKALNEHKNLYSWSAIRTFTVTMSKEESAKKTEQEWKKQLTADEYHVIREKGTERAFTGEYDKFYPKKGEGHFACRACSNPLYSVDAKFDSGCGWPAFDKCYKDSIKTKVDNSLGMQRIEIMCNKCDGHLGHVFIGERLTDSNERHCVNSLSIRFIKGEEPKNKEEEVLKEKIAASI